MLLKNTFKYTIFILMCGYWNGLSWLIEKLCKTGKWNVLCLDCNTQQGSVSSLWINQVDITSFTAISNGAVSPNLILGNTSVASSKPYFDVLPVLNYMQLDRVTI